MGRADRGQVDFEAEWRRSCRRAGLRRRGRRASLSRVTALRSVTIHGGRKTDVAGERREVEIIQPRKPRRSHLRRRRGGRGRCCRLRHRFGGGRSDGRKAHAIIDGRRRWWRGRGGSGRGHGRLSRNPTLTEGPDADHRLLHLRTPRIGGRARPSRGRLALRWIRHQKRMPALRASHLEAGRRNAALVDLIRSLARLALDLEHAPERLSHG